MRPEHNQRYTAALEAYRFQRRGEKPDAYWSALLLIATATGGLWEKVQPYLEIAKGNAWLGQLFAEVDISGGVEVDLAGQADTLDAQLWPVVLEALAVYRGEAAP